MSRKWQFFNAGYFILFVVFIHYIINVSLLKYCLTLNRTEKVGDRCAKAFRSQSQWNKAANFYANER